MGFYGHVIQEIRRLFAKLKVQFVSANDEPTTNILEEEAPVEKLYEPSGAWDEFGIAPKNRWITLHNDSSATEVRLTVGHAAAGAAIEGSETQGFTPVEDLPKDEEGTPLVTATGINYGQYLKVPTLTFDATGHLAAPAAESTNPVYDYFKLPMLTIKANDAVVVSNKDDNILYCKGNQWITFDSEEDNKKLIIQHKIIAPGQENAEVRQGTSKWEYKYPSDLTWCETETPITTETPPSIEPRNNFTIKSPIIPMEGIASAVSAKVLYNTLVDTDHIQSKYLSSSLGKLKTDEQTQITRLTFGDVIKTDEIQVDAMGHVIGIQNKYFMLPISDVPQRLAACETRLTANYDGLNNYNTLSDLIGKFTDIYPTSGEGENIAFVGGRKLTIADTIGKINDIYPLTTENNYYAAPKSLTETIGSYANIYNSSIPNSPKSLTEIIGSYASIYGSIPDSPKSLTAVIGKLDGNESMLSAMQSLNGNSATCESVSDAIQQIVTKYNAVTGTLKTNIGTNTTAINTNAQNIDVNYNALLNLTWWLMGEDSRPAPETNSSFTIDSPFDADLSKVWFSYYNNSEQGTSKGFRGIKGAIGFNALNIEVLNDVREVVFGIGNNDSRVRRYVNGTGLGSLPTLASTTTIQSNYTNFWNPTCKLEAPPGSILEGILRTLHKCVLTCKSLESWVRDPLSQYTYYWDKLSG